MNQKKDTSYVIPMTNVAKKLCNANLEQKAESISYKRHHIKHRIIWGMLCK